MRIAMVGCGYVADFYLANFHRHPNLELAGVMDKDPERAARLSKAHGGLRVYATLSDLLTDPGVQIVLNLTNPRSHYAVSKACLEAGKHVYSEKPLSMVFSEAEDLVRLAEAKGLYLSSAPCNLLGETAQTLWKALRENAVGKVRVAYAELDDGLIHRQRYREWINATGNPWPAKDEFEVGCTMEHAGYYLTWLTAFFGPARTVSSFASCVVKDKETDVPLDVVTPDFTVAGVEFHSGVAARLTCSIVAPHDHQLRIFGEEGVLSTEEAWNYASPVRVLRNTKMNERAQWRPWMRVLPGVGPQEIPPVRRTDFSPRFRGSHQMDFARGPAELADAIAERRPCRLSARHALHVNEIALAIQYPREMGCPRTLTTTFEPIAPMAWA